MISTYLVPNRQVLLRGRQRAGDWETWLRTGMFNQGDVMIRSGQVRSGRGESMLARLIKFGTGTTYLDIGPVDGESSAVVMAIPSHGRHKRVNRRKCPMAEVRRLDSNLNSKVQGCRKRGEIVERINCLNRRDRPAKHGHVQHADWTMSKIQHIQSHLCKRIADFRLPTAFLPKLMPLYLAKQATPSFRSQPAASHIIT